VSAADDIGKALNGLDSMGMSYALGFISQRISDKGRIGKMGMLEACEKAHINQRKRLGKT
jgi:hypothetical protein